MEWCIPQLPAASDVSPESAWTLAWSTGSTSQKTKLPGQLSSWKDETIPKTMLRKDTSTEELLLCRSESAQDLQLREQQPHTLAPVSEPEFSGLLQGLVVSFKGRKPGNQPKIRRKGSERGILPLGLSIAGVQSLKRHQIKGKKRPRSLISALSMIFPGLVFLCPCLNLHQLFHHHQHWMRRKTQLRPP